MAKLYTAILCCVNCIKGFNCSHVESIKNCLIIGFCILLRVILTVNNNTFCFATIGKVFYYVATWYKSSGSCLENREYGRRDPSRWQRGSLYPQKLALTSPTSGGRSVGIVRSRTQTMVIHATGCITQLLMEFSFFSFTRLSNRTALYSEQTVGCYMNSREQHMARNEVAFPSEVKINFIAQKM
jgi:hypothetical protein